MKHPHMPIKQFLSRGFTLLEILIAILIISIGLTALANLQGKLTNYSTIAKQRTLAMNLAEQQIETMHSFYTMGDTGTGACVTAQTGFDDIEDCVDGSTVSTGNMDFNLSWSVADFVQNADGTTEVFTSESGTLRPDLKLVTIKVEWADGQGATRDIELVDIVDSTSIFNTGRLGARVDSNIPPKVPFDADDFPGVVEIAIGDDKIKGSTTPEPQVVNRGTNVITSFDVVTFMQTDSSAYLQRREEFKVLNCICTLDSGLDTGREPTVWNGTLYELGEEVSKRTGSVSTHERGQPAACEMCCGDHHDASSATVKYDNFRPAFTGETGGFSFEGDHAHYGIDNGTKVLATEGDDYLEACRFIRKDGFFKLTTDLSIENLDVVKSTYPTYSNLDYSTSVVNFVTDFSDLVSVPNYPATVPDGTYTSSAPGLFLYNAGVVKQAMSRGIYVDYMPDDLLKKIKCIQADDSGIYSSYCNLLKDPPWLEILPFFDVDLTSLANWNRGSTAITVTNSPISDIDRASFSRGAVELSQEHFSILTDVTAGIEHSNTGLTDTNPIDPDDELEESEDIAVLVLIGGTPPSAGVLVQGEISAGSNQVNIETVRVSQNPPNTACEIVSVGVAGPSAKTTYVCDLSPSPSNGTVTISDYNILHTQGQTTTILNRKVCLAGTAYSSVQVLDEGVVADPDLNIPGERTVMTFSNLSTDATIDIIIEAEADNCP